MADHYDLVVIGAGPGGYVAAIRASQLGMKVACVDKRATLGGTCLNIGCIPSKSLLDSSDLYYLAKNRFDRHGIVFESLDLDLEKMITRKDEVVKTLTDGIAYLFRKNKITPVTGTARLAGNGKVAVKGQGGQQELQAKKILLATGSENVPMPALPYDGTYIVSSTEAMSFEKVPSHLIVVGGGYIGLELGSVWSRLGAKVSILEFLPFILPNSERELASNLQRLLTRQGLRFHLETKVTGASTQGGQVVVNAQADGEGVIFQGDKVLVAAGRRPYTKGLDLEAAGVVVDEQSGRVQVDQNFQTSVEGIYAVGDIIAGPMLAHKASEEGVAVAEIMAGRDSSVNYHTIPSVIYTHPELAGVGLTERLVKESGKDYRACKFSFQANARARCLDETDGLVKVLTETDTDKILGVHILGARASELIGEAVVAMEFGGCAEDIARTCHAHPTMTEAIKEATRGAWEKVLLS